MSERARAALWRFLPVVVFLPLLAAGADNTPPVLVKVRLSVSGKCSLTAADIKFAPFPSGKRCAFTYDGVRNPKTIAFLRELGFRTTLMAAPNAGDEYLRALEEAGAEIAALPWGRKGNYESTIGANSPQECFDALATTRRLLRRACKGPLAVCDLAGHYDPAIAPLLRDVDRSLYGYMAAHQDSNFLMLEDTGGKPHMIYLRPEGPKPLLLRQKFLNSINSEQVPNELIYYQLLANKFAGTLERAEQGQAVTFSLRDFSVEDLAQLKRVIGPYGQHPQIWHATKGELAACEYARERTRVVEVKAAGADACDVVLALEPGVFPPFLLTPLSLSLNNAAIKSATAGGVPCPVTASGSSEEEDEYGNKKAPTGGVFVDVPLGRILRQGCEMKLETAAPDMSIPEKMAVTLAIRNTSGKALEDARLRWAGCPGLSGRSAGVPPAPVKAGEMPVLRVGGLVVEGAPAAPFRLDPGAELKVQATASTTRGARFGLCPVQAILQARVDGEERTFMEGFEIVAAPRLRVEMDPMLRTPMPRGAEQYFLVHLANGRSHSAGGPQNKFIHHGAGACKGTVTFELPAGMVAQPPQQPFELAADSEKTLVFKIRNDEWSTELAHVRPVIRIEGETEPLEVLCQSTVVSRNQKALEYKPLDETGLLVYAGWDDEKKGGDFDRSAGNPKHIFSGNGEYSNAGIKGWCLNANSIVISDSYRNIDYREGTALFWFRRDQETRRNENQYRADPQETAKLLNQNIITQGECILSCPYADGVQTTVESQSHIILRRYASWGGKPGYLQATYQGLNRQLHCAQAFFDKDYVNEWRHVALIWSLRERRLEIYLDGKLAAKAEPGAEEWHGAPWDCGEASGSELQPIASDHGKWCGTLRDEFYIYNRALKLDEIQANMEKARAK